MRLGKGPVKLLLDKYLEENKQKFDANLEDKLIIKKFNSNALLIGTLLTALEHVRGCPDLKEWFH